MFTMSPRPLNRIGRRALVLWSIGLAVHLCFATTASAQNVMIRGVVTTYSGQALEGATITVDGRQISVRTNAQGRFAVMLPAGEYRVTVRYAGYRSLTTTLTVSSGQQSELHLLMGDPPASAPPPPPPPTPAPTPAPPRPDFPQFPWPVPQWTSRYVIPAGVGIATTDTQLGQVEDRLGAALTAAGISEWSVFAVGDSGFAVVTRIENIDKDGIPRNPGRWAAVDPVRGSADPALRRFSLGSYLRALLGASPGYYRVIVLLITNRPVVAADAELPMSGAAALPLEWRTRAIAAGTLVTALVYEFYRPGADDPMVRGYSQILARQHVIKAGIWSDATLAGRN